MSMKEAYQKKLQAKLDEWNADIDKLKAKAVQAGDDVQLKYNEQIDNLKSQQGSVQ